MSTIRIDENAPIIIDFPQKAGVRTVSLKFDDITEKSANAVQSVMNHIHNMARHVTDSVAQLKQKPSEVEVSFGLKFDIEAGAIIAKTGTEASINVTLKWENKKE